jgi:hypothetical protein
MNRATAFNTLVQDFRTWAATNLAGIPVAYPDVHFDPPVPSSPWVRWSLQWSGTMQAGAGRIEDRHTGVAFVECWWPSGLGYKAVDDAADAIAAYYRGYTADNGRLIAKGIYDGQRPYVVVPASEAGWTRRNVVVPIRLIQFIS